MKRKIMSIFVLLVLAISFSVADDNEEKQENKIKVELEITGLQEDVTRSVHFVITECDGDVVTKDIDVEFETEGLSAFGTVEIEKLSSDVNWVSVSEGHTLRRLAPIIFDGDEDTSHIYFVGDTRLLSGDLHTDTTQQDNLIDIRDFSILSSRWQQTIDPSIGSGADITGNGFQGVEDFSFIAQNFLQRGDQINGCI